MKNLLLLSLLSLSLFTSCKKDNPITGEGEYIVFGHFYGECFGESCVEIFKVQDGKLYEDSKDTYPGRDKPYEGEFHPQSDAKYQQAKNLRNEVPSQLLSTTAHVIGMPDAGDWGGLYLEVNDGGETKFWLIDKMESNLPAYLINFKKRIEEAIDAVK